MKKISSKELNYIHNYINVFKSIKNDLKRFEEENKTVNQEDNFSKLDELQFQLLNSIISQIYLICPVKLKIESNIIDDLERKWEIKKLFIKEDSKDNIFSKEMNFLNISNRIYELFEEDRFASIIISTYFIRNAVQHSRHNINNLGLIYDKVNGISYLSYKIYYTDETKEMNNCIKKLSKLMQDKKDIIEIANAITIHEPEYDEIDLQIDVDIILVDLIDLLDNITLCYKESVKEISKLIENLDLQNIREWFKGWDKEEIIKRLNLDLEEL